MKKVLILLMMLCLCACKQSTSDKLAALGYGQDDITKIETFNIDTQDLFLKEYNDIYVDLLHRDGFDANKLDKYVYYYNLLDTDKMIELVNKNIISDSNIDKLKELYSNEYYVERLEDLYLKYLNKYDKVRDLIEIVNTNRYEELYTDIKVCDVNKNYMMLVNKYHQLPSDYEPDDLVDIASEYGRGQTREAVYEAFKQMADDASQAGYSLWICSAYRSYDYQDGLYNMYLEQEGGRRDIVDTYSARPGHSEHQSGLCLDLITPGYSMDDFGLSDASTWVNENCYKYGFIIRYTEAKTNITGYQAEAWQVRYIGDVDAARYIMETGISFDEYYTCFVEV